MSDSRLIAPRLIAGAMSGTSADGVDVALVEIRGRGLSMSAKPLAHAYEPFPQPLRRQILDVRGRGEVKLADLAEIGRAVTLAHVPAFRAALAKANVTADQVAAIAAHGQTLFHGPPNTIQYFDPSLLAYETGCAVVSDFRRADLAAGGQGAPLVPFADWILFRHPTKSRVILNIGGIANLTYLKAGGSIDEVIAFDTGPGNCVSDELCRRFDPAGAGFDDGGRLALEGSVDRSDATRSLMKGLCLAMNDFARRPPPKSTDGPEMWKIFEKQLAATAGDIALPDLLAIANEWTANCVLLAAWEVDPNPKACEWIVGGGGVQNAALWRALNHSVAPMTTTRTIGVEADAREAIAFALLGAATLDGEPSNVPSATGASRRVVLGSITPRPIAPVV